METVFARMGQTEVNTRWGEAFEGIITTITDADGKPHHAPTRSTTRTDRFRCRLTATARRAPRSSTRTGRCGSTRPDRRSGPTGWRCAPVASPTSSPTSIEPIEVAEIASAEEAAAVGRRLAGRRGRRPARSSRRWPCRRHGRWPRSRRCRGCRSSSGRSTRRASSTGRSTTARSRPRARPSVRRCSRTCCPATGGRSSSCSRDGRIADGVGAGADGAAPGRDRARDRAGAPRADRPAARRLSPRRRGRRGAARRRPGIELVPSTRTRWSSGTGAVADDRVARARGRGAARLGVRGADVDGADSLDRSLRAALALEDVVDAHELDGGAFNCHVPQFRFGDDDRDRAVLGARAADDGRPARSRAPATS